jgi:pimeloyl-ACP methyl ester carboxylesterase
MPRQSASLLARGACLALLMSTLAAAAPGGNPAAAPDAVRKTVRLANGMTLGYIELGNRKNPPLVSLHGYTNSSLAYLPLGRLLARDSHVFLLDMRGHGVSGKPECCYSRIDFAYDIKLFLDHFGLDRADIVGHSLGSFVAQTFAAYWPERTRHLVLVASSAGRLTPIEPGKPRAPSALGAAADEAIRNLKDPIDPDSPFMIEWWNVPSLDQDMQRMMRRESAGIPARVWRAMHAQGLASIDLVATIHWIKAPTLLVCGGKDGLFGASDRDALMRYLPQAKLALFPELGHSLPEENPPLVAASIRDFLSH